MYVYVTKVSQNNYFSNCTVWYFLLFFFNACDNIIHYFYKPVINHNSLENSEKIQRMNILTLNILPKFYLIIPTLEAGQAETTQGFSFITILNNGRQSKKG